MKIYSVIDEVKRLKKGYEIDEAAVIKSINDVEMMVLSEIVKGRQGEERYKDFSGYSSDTDRNTELKIPAPYANMYVYYALANIDLEFDEIERYENDIIRFNQSYKDYSLVYVREHRQLKKYNHHYGG